MTSHSLRLLPLLFLGITPAFSQNTASVAFESFDYAPGNLGGLGGGTGWYNTWWSGANADGSVVTTPSIDAIGNKAATNVEWEGSFRVPESGPHTDLAPNGLFGSGDGVMWISFHSQRLGSDSYGGISLFEQFGGEKLFIGSPWLSYAWGIQEISTTNMALVPGTNCDTAAHLVVRLTFTSAGELAEMWVNPASDHPTTTPDASLALGDFQWNEIRIASGGNNGGMTGYDFDELSIEKEVPGIGTNYCTTNLNSTGVAAIIGASGSIVVADNNLTLEATNVPLNQFGYFIGSRTQGYVAHPGGSQGDICLGSPIARFNAIGGYSVGNSGTTGSFSVLLDFGNIPLTPVTSVLAGETWNFQAWFIDNNPGPVNNFTDGLSITFQ